MSWPQVEIQDFCTTGSGTTPSRKRPELFNGHIPWVKSGELRETEIFHAQEHVSEEALKTSSLKIVPAGALLVAMYGATVGRVGILGIQATTNQAVCHVVPDPKRADQRYMFHLLQSRAQELVGRGVGGAQPNISQGTIKQLSVPLPSLEEQRRIAGILDQADALRRLRTRALDKLNTLGQAIFHEMFVANAQNDWPEVAVNEVVENARTGPFGSQMLVSEFVDEGIPVLGIDNVVTNAFTWAKERYITEEKYAELVRYTVLPGDVLITIMGTCGRVAVVPDNIPKAINTKHICCMTLDRTVIDPVFLQAAFLHHPDVLKQLGVQAKGAVMPGLNMGIIKGLKLSLPPLELQQKFALQSLETSGEGLKHKLALDNVGTLFASLQHRAFRGEL